MIVLNFLAGCLCNNFYCIYLSECGVEHCNACNEMADVTLGDTTEDNEHCGTCDSGYFRTDQALCYGEFILLRLFNPHNLIILNSLHTCNTLYFCGYYVYRTG